MEEKDDVWKLQVTGSKHFCSPSVFEAFDSIIP
jgi:hypothetical protein